MTDTTTAAVDSFTVEDINPAVAYLVAELLTSNAFAFDKSKEGGEYWAAIAERIGEIGMEGLRLNGVDTNLDPNDPANRAVYNGEKDAVGTLLAAAKAFALDRPVAFGLMINGVGVAEEEKADTIQKARELAADPVAFERAMSPNPMLELLRQLAAAQEEGVDLSAVRTVH